MNNYNMFDNIENYKDVKNIIYENLITIYRCIPYQDLLEASLKSVRTISYKQERRILSICHLLDRDYKSQSGQHDNKGKKLSILLSSILYLDKFIEKINLYTTTEIILLSDFSANDNLNNFGKNIDLFSRELLNHVYHKTKNYMYREDLMTLLYDRSEYIICKEQAKEKENRKQIEFIRNLTQEEFNMLNEQYARKIAIIAERERIMI